MVYGRTLLAIASKVLKQYKAMFDHLKPRILAPLLKPFIYLYLFTQTANQIIKEISEILGGNDFLSGEVLNLAKLGQNFAKRFQNVAISALRKV